MSLVKTSREKGIMTIKKEKILKNTIAVVSYLHLHGKFAISYSSKEVRKVRKVRKCEKNKKIQKL